MRFRLALFLVLLVAAPATAQPNFKFFEPIHPPRAVQVMAHRGMRVLAPENSLDAVMACASDYIEWAEIDVIQTDHPLRVLRSNHGGFPQ
jgi:glycerophosphoryl diester phosphodiesterase